ncbi:MAG TPA: ATP-dependent protease ATPase subunit HslU, partial [Longimicrobiaceae bacterium]|nr:ATP-dependent protease ATPase subunit HslU [Longimicrobiaceae bacterium]
ASKFTEVGYVGRDVESMVRDLVDMAINMVRTEREDEVQEVAEQRVEDRLLDLLIPPVGDGAKQPDPAASLEQRLRAFVVSPTGQVEDRRPAGDAKPETGENGEDQETRERRERTREKFRQLLRDEKLEDREVEVEVQQSFPMENMMVPLGGGEGMGDFTEMLQDFLPKRTKRRRVTVAEARRILLQDELDKLVNMDEVVDEALERAEQMGIVFLDEIDKIAGERGGAGGPDVSREGVQRDLLPIVEGSTVQTKYGMVRTDHMLFIAAGAFHVSKPSDLIPELQGRFPIRVELTNLTERDFVRILREPKNALLTQYRALVAAEGATLEFTDEGVEAIARTAATVNDRMENIGARRLHTVLTTLLEEILFDLPDATEKNIVIGADTVADRLKAIVEDEDLRRYIL